MKYSLLTLPNPIFEESAMWKPNAAQIAFLLINVIGQQRPQSTKVDSIHHILSYNAAITQLLDRIWLNLLLATIDIAARRSILICQKARIV